MKIKQLVTLAVVALTLFSVQALESNDDLKARIQPVGSVHIAGAAAAGAGAAASGSRSGEDIYKGACAACHSSGVLGAPKTQNAGDWGPRLAEKGKKGVWRNAIKGINAMPPMGACGNCSEDDIMAAIDYMIEGVE
jgi:cytochrome c5